MPGRTPDSLDTTELSFQTLVPKRRSSQAHSGKRRKRSLPGRRRDRNKQRRAFSLDFWLFLGNHIGRPRLVRNKNNSRKKHASFNVERFFKKRKMAKRLGPTKSRAQFVPDGNSSDSADSEVRIMKVTSWEVATGVPTVPTVQKKRVTWRSELEDVQ